MLRGVFFDLGGTLADISAWDSDEAYAYDLEVLKSLGCNLTLRQCREEFLKARRQLEKLCMGSPARHHSGIVFSTVCRNLGLEADPALAVSVDCRVLNELLKAAKVADGAIEVLEQVHASGRKTALVCNGAVMRTGMLIDRLGLRKFFDTVVISEEVGYEKCTGAPFRAALRRLKLLPEHVIMVGDDPYEDVEGAKKAGIKPVLLAAGRRKKCGAGFVIKSLKELPGLLARLQ